MPSSPADLVSVWDGSNRIRSVDSKSMNRWFTVNRFEVKL